MSKSNISRRDFIRTGTTALAAAIAAPLVGFESEASSGKPPLPMQPITLDLSDPKYAALSQAGGAMKIPNPHDAKKPIIVSRISESDVAAFSSKCTHWGCEVPLPANHVITCPCHGSKFDATGKVTHGPAKKNLEAFSAVLSGTTLTIKDMTS
ncbi:MAG TPA: Rieske 2Fe-2S domain-containing protein [Chitinivibrionales bacterium]|nr:Rieske 2Fe-2S domain-containing protein [Chitinivibrionales bacterium]